MKDKNKSQLIIYQTESGETKIDVRFQNETVWLSQQLMAELFQTTKQNVSLHIGNIYVDEELVPQSTVKKFLTVRKEGTRDVQRNVEYYNLDMIISGKRALSPFCPLFAPFCNISRQTDVPTAWQFC